MCRFLISDNSCLSFCSKPQGCEVDEMFKRPAMGGPRMNLRWSCSYFCHETRGINGLLALSQFEKQLWRHGKVRSSETHSQRFFSSQRPVISAKALLTETLRPWPGMGSIVEWNSSNLRMFKLQTRIEKRKSFWVFELSIWAQFCPQCVQPGPLKTQLQADNLLNFVRCRCQNLCMRTIC